VQLNIKIAKAFAFC